MIHGHKPNGYTLTYSREGKRIEAETRQCIHCQYSWDYGQPHDEELIKILGHPTRRGYCYSCHGWICCRDSCLLQQKKLVAQFLHQTGKIRNCIPFEEWNSRLRDKIERLLPLDPGLTITPSGVIVPVHTLED